MRDEKLSYSEFLSRRGFTIVTPRVRRAMKSSPRHDLQRKVSAPVLVSSSSDPGTQCWQYRPDVSFVDCLTANSNVAASLTPTLSQFHTASAITADSICRTLLRPLTRVLTIRASRTQSKLILNSEISLRKPLDRLRHDVAVYNTSPARTSPRYRRILYGAPKNTAGAVITIHGDSKQLNAAETVDRNSSVTVLKYKKLIITLN